MEAEADALAVIQRLGITPARMDEAEQKLLALPQCGLDTIHHFGPGIYVREGRAPAGALVMGHAHKKEHMNIFLRGRITLLQTDGEPHEITAPLIFTARPGRKIAFVHEDLVWLNLYATEETTVTSLDDQIFQKSDYWSTLKADDLAPLLTGGKQQDHALLPYGSYKVRAVPGQGIYSTAMIAQGELICPLMREGKPTVFGLYLSHAERPNAVVISTPSGLALFASRDIRGGIGGHDGERITVKETVREAT